MSDFIRRFRNRSIMFLLAAAVLLLLFSPAGCSRRSRVPMVYTGPAKAVVLPFNVPADDKEFQWTALAAPILLAKISEQIPDLEIVPFWEIMPASITMAGAVRSFDEESAISVANWGGARWAIMGEIAPARRGFSVTIDFLPIQDTQVPFRFVQNRRLQHLGTSFYDALRQFSRYRSARPIPPSMGNEPGMDRMKAFAEAVDREYGWFVTAEPGSAAGIVGQVEPADMPLARILFNPGSYPELKAEEEQ